MSMVHTTVSFQVLGADGYQSVTGNSGARSVELEAAGGSSLEPHDAIEDCHDGDGLDFVHAVEDRRRT
jgi:hypothetical protein